MAEFASQNSTVSWRAHLGERRVLFGIRLDPACPNSVSLVLLARILNGQAGSTEAGVALPRDRHRKSQPENRTLSARALHADFATVILHDLMDCSEAQSDTFCL